MEADTYQIEIDSTEFDKKLESLTKENKQLVQEKKQLEQGKKAYISALEDAVQTLKQVQRVIEASKSKNGAYLDATHYHRDFIADLVEHWIHKEIASIKRTIEQPLPPFDVEM